MGTAPSQWQLVRERSRPTCGDARAAAAALPRELLSAWPREGSLLVISLHSFASRKPSLGPGPWWLLAELLSLGFASKSRPESVDVSSRREAVLRPPRYLLWPVRYFSRKSQGLDTGPRTLTCTALPKLKYEMVSICRCLFWALGSVARRL